MGTRGNYGFIIDGKSIEMYNHFDSYPSGLGNDIVKYLLSEFQKNGYDDAIGLLKQRVRSMEVVDEDVAPTPEQKKFLKEYTNLQVSTGSDDDWYCILRDTQGDIEKSLAARYYIDGTGISGQEYTYLINLDTEMLEFSGDGEKNYPLHSLDENTYEDMEKQSPYYEEENEED